MTVKEFYEYMKKNGAENYEMGTECYNGYEADEKEDWQINHKEKKVTTNCEC